MNLFNGRLCAVLSLSLAMLTAPSITRAQEEPAVGRVATTPNLFTPPSGLTKPVDVLLRELGYLDCCSETPCIPFSYNFCMEVAIKCHVQRRYVDSMAFVTRACEIATTRTALYLRALNELALHQCDEAASTVVQLKSLPGRGTDYSWLREKLSSPLTVMLKAVFESV